MLFHIFARFPYVFVCTHFFTLVIMFLYISIRLIIYLHVFNTFSYIYTLLHFVIMCLLTHIPAHFITYFVFVVLYLIFPYFSFPCMHVFCITIYNHAFTACQPYSFVYAQLSTYVQLHNIIIWMLLIRIHVSQPTYYLYLRIALVPMWILQYHTYRLIGITFVLGSFCTSFGCLTWYRCSTTILVLYISVQFYTSYMLSFYHTPTASAYCMYAPNAYLCCIFNLVMS